MKKTVNGKNQIQQLAKLRKKILVLQELEEGITKKAISHIETYGSLKQGNWSAIVNVIKKKCPHWKDELKKMCGIKKVNLIIAKTKSSSCIRLSIQYKGVKRA